MQLFTLGIPMRGRAPTGPDSYAAHLRSLFISLAEYKLHPC